MPRNSKEREKKMARSNDDDGDEAAAAVAAPCDLLHDDEPNAVGVTPVVTVDCSAPGAPEAIRDALRTIGCFYAVGLGVRRRTVSTLLARSRDFFSLPLEAKMRIRSDANFRGYTPMSDEKLGEGDDGDGAISTYSTTSVVGDFKEGVYFGRDLPDDGTHPLSLLPLHGPNQWPSEADAPGYRGAVEASFEEFRGAAGCLMRLVALALGVEEDFFVRKFSSSSVSSSSGASGRVGESKNDDNDDNSAAMDFVRTLHYAPRRSRPELGELGANPHRDYGE